MMMIFVSVFAVLMLCLFSSCQDDYEILQIETDSVKVMNLNLSTTQGSVYDGYSGTLSVYSRGKRLERLRLIGANYVMSTDYTYSGDSLFISQTDNKDRSSLTTLGIGADGLPYSFYSIDKDGHRSEGTLEFCFNSSAQLTGVHIQREHGRRNIWLEYIYDRYSTTDCALIYASFWPDGLINTYSARGVGELVAFLGTSHAQGMRLQQINITETCLDYRCLHEITVVSEDKGLTLESRVISTYPYLYGDPQTNWIDKNMDSIKFYQIE